MDAKLQVSDFNVALLRMVRLAASTLVHSSCAKSLDSNAD